MENLAGRTALVTGGSRGIGRAVASRLAELGANVAITHRGAVEPMKTILSSPGLENLWQMHWSYNAGVEANTPGQFSANIEDVATK